MGTYSFSQYLPSLPLPTLEDTCHRFLSWVEPLVSETIFADTKKTALWFMEKEGKLLQKELEKLIAQSDTNQNWLKPFWDSMYLEYRGALPINMSYFFQWKSSIYDQNKFSEVAGVILSILNYFRKLSEESLPAEQIKGRALCMEHFRSMFYTRNPQLRRDVLHLVPNTKPMHIVVAHQGHFFTLSISDENGIVSKQALAKVLKDISHLTLTNTTPVGAITTTERNNAAKIHTMLLQSSQNEKILQDIESALLVVCLDIGYKGELAFCEALLKASGSNRWYDKSIQLILAEDGRIGFNLEHTGCDASSWMNMIHFISSTPLAQNKQEHVPVLKKLEWDISDELAQEIDLANEEFYNFAHKVKLYPLIINDINKQTIKQYKCSPDAFIQLAIQVSQYKVYGSLQSCYEAVSTRSFFQGRTECIRSSTAEAKALAQAMQDNLSNDNIRVLFLAATQEHITRMKDCQKGHGVERHLFGLYKIWQLKGEALGITKEPAIFNDLGYKALTTNTISTSSSGSEFLTYFGFGPVVVHGIGIGYGTTNNNINFILTTQNQDIGLKDFARELKETMTFFQSILNT